MAGNRDRKLPQYLPRSETNNIISFKCAHFSSTILSSTYRVGKNSFLQTEKCLVDETGRHPELNVFVAIQTFWLQRISLQDIDGFGADGTLTLGSLFIHKSTFARFATCKRNIAINQNLSYRVVELETDQRQVNKLVERAQSVK